MQLRPLLRCAIARARGFLRGDSLPPPELASLPSVASGTVRTDPSIIDDPATNVGVSTPESGTAVPASFSLALPPDALHEPHYQQGLRMVTAQRWNWAQRELELAVRAAPDSPAGEDLASVRAVRRHLPALAKWPWDAGVYVELGRCYMELDLGQDAERAFRRAITLAPRDPAAYYYLALEYCYRGADAEAERVYTDARSLVETLPSFAMFLAECRTLGGTAYPTSPKGGPEFR